MKTNWLALMAVALLLLGLGTLTQRPVRAQDGLEWPEIELIPMITGLTSPVQVTHAGDGSERIFVVEKSGRIRIYQNGTLLGTPFLDIRSVVSTGSEQGLLGVAFAPDYATDGDFYVDYTDTSGDTRIVRYHVSASDPNQADPASAQGVLTVPQPYTNHNGGQLLFGPDGLLYIGMGDGGSGGDPGNRAQDLGTLLGKMLRIDVETGDPATYTIPPSNPFVGVAGAREEIWALGVRNPWRFSFDSATGDLYIGDVGQNQWEEVDFQPASSQGGENYGWRCYEGTHAYNLNGCGAPSNYTFPIQEYSHSQDPDFHCAVTGGTVYRGTTYARMEGVYFYADYCSGYIWGLRYNGSAWENQLLLNSGLEIVSFGTDEAEHLYLTTLDSDTVYEVVDTGGPVTSVGLGSLESRSNNRAPLLLAGLLLAGGAAVLVGWRVRRGEG